MKADDGTEHSFIEWDTYHIHMSVQKCPLQSVNVMSHIGQNLSTDIDGENRFFRIW